MAKRNKYSRRIVVDGVAYRWRVPPVAYYKQTQDGHIVAHVWLAEKPGQRLRLIGGFPWFETGNPTDAVTPRAVADGIRTALRAGWASASRLGTFQLLIPRADRE